MAEYQITYWREIPSLVVARVGDDGTNVTKTPLPGRFQEAVDEAAMRLGDVDSDAYLQGWRRSDWETFDGSPVEACDAVVLRLEQQWTEAELSRFLQSLGSGPRGTR